MIVGIAMPSWSSGFIGICYGDLETFENIVDYVRSYCYVDTLDLVKVQKFKRTCVIRGVRRSIEGKNVRLILTFVDIYGIVNELCTKYHINRLEIIPELYDMLLDIPQKIGLYGDIYVDSEIGERISDKRRSKVIILEEAGPVQVAKFVASLPETCQCTKAEDKYRVFSLDTEDIRVEFYDFKSEFYERAMSIVRLKLSGNSHEVS
ncbi:MAG: hypothetical protein GXO26_07515 [Crenarchaeota archaeon]|nr:hypothetical protein [Thermoproteota archaeon]